MVNKRNLVIAGLIIAAAAALTLPLLYKKPSNPSTQTQAQTTTQTTQTTNSSATTSNGHNGSAQSIKTPTPSLTDLSNLIQNDDNPYHIQYTVTSVNQPSDGWLVAILTAKNQYGSFIQYAILDHDEGGWDLAYGPTTSFPSYLLVSKKVPQAVINEVPTYVDSQ